MKWNDLRIRYKFALAFGVIALLFVGASIWAVVGIEDIIKNATYTSNGNKIKTSIAQHELAHINWANSLNEFLINDEVTSLNIETDHRNCDMGKMLYGEKRKFAETILPNLKPLFLQIEKPHEDLHSSAKEIMGVFEQGNYKISTELTEIKSKHLIWLNSVTVAIAKKDRRLDVETDGNLCSLGKWLNSDHVKEILLKYPEYSNILKSINEPHLQLHKSAENINIYLKAGDFNRAEQELNNNTLLHANQVIEKLDQIIESNNAKLNKMMEAELIHDQKTTKALEKIKEIFKEMNYIADRDIITDDVMINKAVNTKSGVIIFVIIAIFIAFSISIIFSRNIELSLLKGVEFAKKIAQGDLTAEVTINQKDEIGQLSKALNGMVKTLKQMVLSIHNGARYITELSREMSMNSQQMAQGTNEQASSTEEVSSTMEQMHANIQQNADNAKQTEEIANKASLDIEKGNSAVLNTVQSMKTIAEKISIISEIAYQTNILALNAAVEAARVGDEGKGFAVVAAEVRTLAERSRKAAEEIDVISKESVAVAEKSGKILGEIVPDIQKTEKLVKEITVSSIEQSSSIMQVSNAVEQLNKVTQQSSAISEEVASSSEELESQAEQLRDMIGYFNVGNENTFTKKKTISRKKTKTTNTFQPTELKNKSGFTIDLNDSVNNDFDFEKF